jgi:hypothetical protein
MARRLLVALFAVAALINGADGAVMTAERGEFLLELTRALLSSESPKAERDGGWTGVVLSPPGQALSPVLASFDAVGSDRVNVAQALADAALFDRSLVVSDGVGNSSPFYLADSWKTVLDNSMPRKAFPRDGLGVESQKWLFRLPDRVERARGIDFVGEPSVFFLRYREYELLYQLLANAKTSSSGILDGADSWRRHPRLSKFANLENAMRSIAEDWVRFGHRAEIDKAKAELDDLVGSKEWVEWLRVKAKFDTESIDVGRTGKVYRTLLSPPPSEWLRMGSWVALSVQTLKKETIRFQMARVRIDRPWLDMESLVSGGIKIADDDQRSRISSGRVPTLTSYPPGRLSVYAVELVIVKNIQVSAGAVGSLHPLALFASPDQIQLLGYIVRVTPKLP